MLREEQDISMTQEEALERIPNIKKLAGPADTIELGGNRTKNSPVLPLKATVCGHLSRTEEKVRTITGQRSRSMQSVRTLHVRYNETTRRGKENIRNRERTKNN